MYTQQTSDHGNALLPEIRTIYLMLVVTVKLMSLVHMFYNIYSTLLYSKSQHLTCLSSPQLNKYGCLVLKARPLTVLTWPVSDKRSLPLAKSQILITLSAEPVANHSLPGSTATHLQK